MSDLESFAPAVFPTAEDQRAATAAERRASRTNRRTFDRASGHLESVAEAQARYAALGLDTTTPLELRDNGSSPRARTAPPVDRHASPSDAERERERHAAETAAKFGFPR